MMGGGGNSISVPVNLKLEVLQSSLTQLQNLLNKLTPNSKGFKDLQNIVSSITGNMEKLSAQTSKPFINQAQFSQAEKTIENIEEGFSRAQLIANRIEFSDLKLDSSQMAAIESFNQQIEQLKANFESLKETEKIKLLGDVDFSGLKDIMNPNTLTGNFDEVIKQITKKSKELENAYFSAQQNLENLEKSRDLGQAAEKIQSGFTDKKGNILPDFEQYFRKLSTSGGIGFKSGQKTAFKEYLIKTFSLDKTEVEELFKKTASEIQAELANPDGLLANAIKTGADARAKLPDARRKMNEAKANADTGQKGLEAAARAQEEVANGADRMNEKTEQVTQGLHNVEQAAVDAARAEGNLGSSQNQLTDQFEQFRRELANASNGLTKAQSQMNTFNGIKNAVVNFLGFNQVLNITRNAIRNAINHIKELDTTMNGIAIVTNMTTADLWNQVEAYSAMAQNFGVTIQGAYEVSKIYYQAGYDTNEVLTLTNETLKLSKISGLDYATTTDYMMTAMRGFKLEMEDASRVVDVYSNLAANTAVSQQELAEAMTRTASSMESVGATFEETSAMIATMVAVTRESANNIGSAMKSIASRYGELKKDPLSLVDAEGEAMDFNKVDTALKSVGISLKTTDNQFRDFTDVILELAEVWDTLDSAQQRYIATQFAGNRQQSRFLALISNIDLLKENLYNAENSEDVGTLQAIKALDSLESKINQVQVAYQQFYTTVGIEEAWKGLLDWLTRIIENLNNLPKIFGKIPGAAIVVISNLITLIRTLLSKATEILAKTWQMTLQQMKSVSMQEGKEAGQVYTQEFQKQLAKVKANKVANNLSLLSAGLSTVSMMLDQTSETGRKAAAGLMAVAGAAKLAAGAVQIASGNYVQGFINIISSIAEILSANGIYWETAEEKAQRLKKAAEEASTEAKKIKAETNTLSNSIEKIKTLREERYKSTEAAEEYKETINELADSFPALVQGFDEAGNAIVDITEAEEYLALQRKQSAKAAYEAAKAETDAAWAQVEADQETLSTKEKRFNVGETGNIRERIATLNFTNDSKFDRNAGDEGYLSQLYSLLEDNSSNLVEENLDDVEVKSKYTVAQLQKAVIDYFDIKLDPIEEAFLLMGEITEDYNVKNINLAREALQIFQNVEVQDEKIKKQRDDAEAQLKEYLSSSQALQLDTYAARNKTKQEIATYQYDKSYFSSGIENLISTYLFDQVDKQGKLWDRETDFTKEETRVVFNAFDELWANLDEETQEALKKMISDTYHFSGSDIVKYLQSKNIDTSNIENVLIEPYNKVEKEIEDGIKEAITKNSKANSSLTGKIQLILKNNQVTEYERQLYIQLLELSDVYGQLGLTGPQFETVLDRIKELPPEMQNQIITNGFNTVEAIENTIKYLESNGEKELAGKFEELKDATINNLQLTLTTAVDSLIEGFDNINEEIGKMTSGLNIKEALDLVKRSEALKNFDLSLSDFMVVNGKLITTQETAQQYWNSYIKDIAEKQKELESQVDLVSNINVGEEFTINENEYKALIALLGGAGIAAEDYFEKQADGSIYIKTSTEEFIKAVEDARTAAGKTVDNYTQVLEWATQMMTEEFNWDKGNYNGLGYTNIAELANAQGLSTEGKGAQIRAAKEKINTAYSNLISDVLEKGFDNINLQDYKGLVNPEEIKGNLKGRLTDFIKQYAIYTGKTTQEINALIVQAMEKDNEKALVGQEVAENVDVYSKTIMKASLDNIQKLADAMGADIETYYYGDIDSEGKYFLTQAAITALENSSSTVEAILEDGAYSVANSIAKFFEGAVNGTLNNVDTQNFETMLKTYGIENIELQWIQTSEGFKLADKSAIKLYQTLKSIEGLQNKITFQDLKKSLEESNASYKDIATITKRIAELQRLINKANAEQDDSKKKQYEAELEVAEEIYKTRLKTDSNDWDLSNPNMPDGAKNPVSFFTSAAKFEKMARDANKQDYIKYTDFYNMLYGINNAAAMSGQSIQFLGESLDGTSKSIQTIQNKIQDAVGYDAGGEMIVNLKSFGGAIVEGAEGMGTDFHDAIQIIAQNQVDLLDAEIQVLENFVALENLELDSDGNGLISDEEFEAFADDETKLNTFFNGLASILGVGIEDIKAIWDADVLTPEQKKDLLQNYLSSLADYDETTAKENLLSAMGLDEDTLDEIKKAGQEKVDLIKQIYKEQANAVAEGGDSTGRAKTGDFIDTLVEKTISIFSSGNMTGENGAGEDTVKLTNKKIISADKTNRLNKRQSRKGNEDNDNQGKNFVDAILPAAYDLQESGKVLINSGVSLEDAGEDLQGTGEVLQDAGEVLQDAADALTNSAGANKDNTDISSGPENNNNDNNNQGEGISQEEQQKIIDNFNELYESLTEEERKAFQNKLQYQEYQNLNHSLNVDESGNFDKEIVDKAVGLLNDIIKARPEEAGQGQQPPEGQSSSVPGLSLVSTQLRLLPAGAPPIIGATGVPTNLEGKSSVQGKTEPYVPKTLLDLFQQLQQAHLVDANKKASDISEEEMIAIAKYGQLIAKGQIKSSDSEQQEYLNSNSDLFLFQSGRTLANWAERQAYGALRRAEGNLDPESEEYKQLEQNLKIAEEVYAVYKNQEDAGRTYDEIFSQISNSYLSELENSIEEIVTDLESVEEGKEKDIPNLVSEITKKVQEGTYNKEDYFGIDASQFSKQNNDHVEIDQNQLTNLLTEAANQLSSDTEKAGEGIVTSSTEIAEAASTNVDALVKAAQGNEDLAFQVKTSGYAISVMGEDSSAAGQQLSAFQSYLSTTASPLRDLEITAGDLASAFRILNSVTPSGVGQAKGNVALAKGTKTLMGELGPELYVANGRYYVAGQNGAEFVNLPDDAIVFNHLQTKRLLENGSTGRGKAINGENKAVAFAKGTGPAKASASAVLNQLQELRGKWAALLTASAQDLANAGGGGGGGDDDKQLKNVTAEIQRWYNLLRQIDKLEKDISYQEQLRAKIESDRVVNGRAMYSTYKEELKYLDQEIARNKELANLQKSWYDHKREELANSAYGKIFTYDENGLQQYVGDSRPGSGLGLDILEHLTQMKVTGEAVGAAKNVKTQLDYLQSVGFDIEALKFNKDGTTIDTKKLKGDKLDEAYVQMMQNFWDSVDGWRDELDGIYDSYHEQLENVISNEEKRNGLLQEIIDNQLSVEQSVYKAIEEREQAAIDRAQEERDALSDSADKFLDGLSEQLDKERNMYDRNQSSEELNKLRRQLAILQRSGGSASQIRELQNQITSQEQDAYFQAQQDQIDAIKEASDAQLERLDHQIDIMTETLEYQKEHGLLWKEVYDVMAGTPEQIQQFIQENTPDFQSNSALQVMEDLRKLKGEIELWISSRDDSDNPIYTDAGHNWSSYVEASQNRYKDILTDELLAQAKAAFDAEYVRSSDPNAAGAAADAILNKKLEEYNRAHAPANATGNDTANTINNGKNGSGKYWNIRYPDGGQAGKRFGSKQEAEAWKKQMVGLYESIYKDNLSDSTADAETVKKAKADFEKWKNSTIFSYSHGGLADYTGLAMVHGSKTKPEAFLNAEQTAMWKNDILGKHNSLTSLLLDFTSALGDLADSNTYNTINRGEAINIDKAEVIMNVGSIANDYDARRAGESALEEMLNIARKTGTRGVSRR